MAGHSLLDRWQLMGAITRDVRMTAADVAVAWTLLQRYNPETGDAWPSLHSIAADTKRGRSTIAESIARLVGNGYFTRISGGGRANSTHYAPVLETVRLSGHIEPKILSGEADSISDKMSARSDSMNGCHEEKLSAPAGTKLSAPAGTNMIIEPDQRDKKNLLHKRDNETDSQFDEFWTLYPRKIDRAKARIAFSVSLKRARLETILDGARRYAAERKDEDPKFTKHAATWLRAEAWSNPTETRTTPHPTGRAGIMGAAKAIFDKMNGESA